MNGRLEARYSDATARLHRREAAPLRSADRRFESSLLQGRVIRSTVFRLLMSGAAGLAESDGWAPMRCYPLDGRLRRPGARRANGSAPSNEIRRPAEPRVPASGPAFHPASAEDQRRDIAVGAQRGSLAGLAKGWSAPPPRTLGVPDQEPRRGEIAEWPAGESNTRSKIAA